jgi:hypothetical protein
MRIIPDHPEEINYRWTFRPPHELNEEGGISWIVGRHVGAGLLTLLSAPPKAGKTTFIFAVLAALERGAWFLGYETQQGRALVVTEEPGSFIVSRAQFFGIGGGVLFCPRPFIARPSAVDWRAFLEHILDVAVREGASLLVLDTLPAVWPCVDENQAELVLDALSPLRALTESGLAVLAVTHTSKAGGLEGRGTRGSSALVGAADVVVEMSRFTPERPDDPRRILRAFSRSPETPLSLVIRWDGGQYKVEGEAGDVRLSDEAEALLEVLPTSPPGMTLKEIRTALRARGDLRGEGAVRRVLGVLAARGEVVQEAGPPTRWRCGVSLSGAARPTVSEEGLPFPDPERTYAAPWSGNGEVR